MRPTWSKLLSIALAIVAVFLIANTYQTSGENFFGQYCSHSCLRPAWLVLGAVLGAVAYLLWPSKSQT
jgi:drug/metabolite transporter (DMT)-like permease